MASMQNRTLSQEDLNSLESLMTAITHLVMLIPADKLELFIEACEHQESVFAAVHPQAFLKFVDQLERGADVAKLILEFRRKLEAVKNTCVEGED